MAEGREAGAGRKEAAIAGEQPKHHQRAAQAGAGGGLVLVVGGLGGGGVEALLLLVERFVQQCRFRAVDAGMASEVLTQAAAMACF